MSLSRLQLAAALLEYDNIEDDPYRPKVSHRDSALFKPHNPRPLDDVPLARPLSGHQRPQSTFSQRRLSQPLSPNRPGTLYDPGRDRQSRYDVEEQLDEYEAAPAPDVDLDRWDLPDHLLSPETSGPQASRPLPTRVVTDNLADRRSRQLPPLRSATSYRPQPITSPLSDRVNSVHLDVLDGIPLEGEQGDIDAYEQAQEVIARAQRVQSMYDTGSRNPVMVPLPPSPASTLTSFRPISSMGGEMMGSRSGGRSFDGGRPASVMSRSSYDMLRDGSREDARLAGPRPGSSMSRNSYDALRSPGTRPKSALEMNAEEEEEEVLAPNPFALPAPPMEIGSRFDPKVLDAQRRSIDLIRPMSRMSLAVSSPDQVAFDPASLQFASTLTEEHLTAHATGRQLPETEINPLAGRQLNTFADIPTAKEYGKPLRPSKYGPLPPVDRRSLLRPKTIILPTPLSNVPEPVSPPKNIPEGYTLGDKPLPPGSRSSILTTDMRGRPGLPLSLSQKTFRSSLMVGGRREDDAYWVGGATEDGQVGVEYAGEGDEAGPIDRRPGKLYGKSLMDQLEARKTAMKAKQRVFTGDSRPAMMARVDQPDRPQSMLLPPGHRQPLLHMDSSGDIDVNAQPESGALPARPTDRLAKSASVFGVDKIWEREMAKLKVIQEREARDAAERAAKEEAEAKRKEAKKGKKKKPAASPILNATEDDGLLAGQEPDMDVSPVPRVPDLPPQLAYSPEKAVKPMPEEEQREDDDEDAGAERDAADGRSLRSAVDEGRLIESDPGSDSEEDVPLSRFARDKSASVRRLQVESDSDSEEDVPLSKLVSPAKANHPTSLSLPTADSGTGSLGLDVQPGENPANDGDDDDNDEGEDDVPLALRKNGNIEDDLPLGYKHADAVQRKTAEAWRASMASSPQFGGMPNGIAVPPSMGYPWGYQDPNAMMNAYSSVYGMPNMGMGYLSPAMTGMSGMPGMPGQGMGGMGWGGQMMPGMAGMGMPGMPGLSIPGIPGMDMSMPEGPMPPQASKNIDNWRKEVAIQPVPTGGSSVRD